MALQDRDKTALKFLVPATALAAVIIVVATALLVRGADEPSPQLSLATGDGLVHVAPAYWCDAELTECRPHAPTAEDIAAITSTPAPVAIGKTLVLSVPAEVADGPWSLQATYWTPQGLELREWVHRSGATFSQSLESTADRVLLGVEIKPITVVQAPAGDEMTDDFLARAIFSANTTPKGFEVPAGTGVAAAPTA